MVNNEFIDDLASSSIGGVNTRDLWYKVNTVTSRNNLAISNRTVTANTTLDVKDSTIVADTTSSSLTLTLQSANSWGSNRTPIISIIKSSPSNTLRLNAAAGDSIVSQNQTTTSSVGIIGLAMFISDGVSKWYQISDKGFISVMDFGAVGDGTTDDFTPINNAMNAVFASGGGMLFFPAKTFAHATAITLLSNVILIGWGATLLWTGGASAQITSSSSGVLEKAGIHGMEINGSTTATKNIELRSAVQCSFMDIDFNGNNTTSFCLDMLVNTSGGTNYDGNRNAANNVFTNLSAIGTCGTALRMTGDSTAPTVITLNTFNGFIAKDCRVRGIDFASWCDSNYFSGVCRMSIVGNNSVGVEWNTSSPTSNVGVYANNFSHLAVDTFGTYTGRIGIKMNWTKQNKIEYFFQEPVAEGGAYSFSANAQSYYVGHIVGTTSNLIIRSKLAYYQGADQPLFAVGGSDMSTDTTGILVGFGRSGSGNSYLSLVGDTTYTDYGLRVIRNNGGSNTSSQILHKGTGNLEIKAETAGGQVVIYDSTGAKFVVNNTGVGFQGSAGYGKPTITGSRAGNAALASLLTELANYGLITDGTTA